MTEANPLFVNLRASAHPFTIRVRGLPHDETVAREIVHRVLLTRAEDELEYNISIVPSCEQENKATAIVTFPSGPPDFLGDIVRSPGKIDGVYITIDTQFIGFTQLSKSKEAIEADVIAICGINGHAYASWQSKEAPNPMLLQDLLSDDFPSCRFMTWGYSGKLTRLDHATLDDYARELLEDLKRIRRGTTRNRPLIFLTHSFGGIVLVRALLLAERDAASDPGMASILDALLGVVFFAVPHGGMDIDNISQIIGPLDHPRHNLIQHIDSNSQLVETQREEFREFVSRHHTNLRRFKVISFYETEQSQHFQQDENGTWRRSETRSLLLSRTSALVGLPRTMETSLAIHKDHSGIIKFKDKDDNYTRVQRQLGLLLEPLTLPDIPPAYMPSTNDHSNGSIAGPSRASIQPIHTPSDNATQPHVSFPVPSNLSRTLVRAILASAVVTASFLPNGDFTVWPWKRKGWAFWGVAIPAALFMATYEFPGSITTSTDPPRRTSED